MSIRALISKLNVVIITLLVVSSVFANDFPKFDRGPDPDNPMHREFLEILADMPNVPELSEALQVLAPHYKNGQKMRPDFGAMPFRGLFEENSIQVLVIGQDGTHIAEAANNPGIAGFGGRVHDMLKHFGIFDGVAFTNLFVNTISGQYGSRNTPTVVEKRGKKSVVYQNVIENRQWLMTHEGPYAQWRNRLLSWIIRNNKDSLKMVMMLGQAGKDAGANFFESIGGQIDGRVSDRDRANTKVPLFEMVGAGGNNEWAVPITKDGKDVAEVLYNKKRKGERYKKFNYKSASDQKLAKQILARFPEDAEKLMVFSNGGPDMNGVMRAEQFGGWDWRTAKVNGKETLNIKGLLIPDENGGYVRAGNIVFTGSPHPTSLSMSDNPSEIVERQLLAPLYKEMKMGWKPPVPEEGRKSNFLAKRDYDYGRGEVPRSHLDPGITDLRGLPVSTAKRLGKDAIQLGSRDGGITYGRRGALEKMAKDDRFGKLPDPTRARTGRPLYREWMFKYDRGPDDYMADLLLFDNSIDEDRLFATKRGQSWSKSGNKSTYVKSHRDAGLFGHYRGTFDKPKAIVWADHADYDSIATAKAMTGERGQMIQGLMDDLGIDKDYLVLNTAPVGMEGATARDWEYVLEQTEEYRENIMRELLRRDTPDFVLADGPNAAKEMARILKKLDREDVKVINMRRGSSSSYGIRPAGERIKDQVRKYRRARISGERSDIPREHLSWRARVWEGTSGTRVLTANTKKHAGKAFAIVRPDWAMKHEVRLTRETYRGLQEMLAKLEAHGEPIPNESVAHFIERRSGFVTEWESALARSLRGNSRKGESASAVVESWLNLENATSCQAVFGL